MISRGKFSSFIAVGGRGCTRETLALSSMPSTSSSSASLPVPSESLTPEQKDALGALVQRLMTAPLRESRSPGQAPLVDVSLSIQDVALVTRVAVPVLLRQSSLVQIEHSSRSPLFIFGDLHGQFRDLRQMSAELLLLLLSLRLLKPERVTLLRGNHEDCNTSMVYGFYDECMYKFKENGEMAFTFFVSVFNVLPLAAVVGGRILCMHGGLSPRLRTLDDINQIRRPTLIPSYGLVCDLVWSDPGGTQPGFALSSRGVSFSFHDSVVEAACTRLQVDFIIRAHQISQEMRDGHKFFAGGRLLSIFSAPGYQGQRNGGAVVRVTRDAHDDLACRLLTFRPTTQSRAGHVSPFEFSIEE